MAPTFEHVLTLRLFIGKDEMLAIGPSRGNAPRYCAPLVSGYLQGDGFKADLIQGGSDRPRVDESAGIAHLTGGAHYRDKETGDTFYATFKGILKMDEATQLAFVFSPDAKSTKAGDHTWLTTPMFEVSNEKYKASYHGYNTI